MKKNNFKSLAAVLSLAMAATAVPVNANAAAAPKLTVDKKTVYSGETYSATVKNLKKGYTVQFSSTQGGVNFAKKKITATGKKVTAQFTVKAAKKIADGSKTKIKAVVKDTNGKTVKTVNQTVTLKQLAKGLTVKDLAQTTVQVGDTVNADATISPKAAKGAYKKTFTSSNSSVLKVTNASNGLFEAVAPGTATISVSAVNDLGVVVEGSKTLTVTVAEASTGDEDANKPDDTNKPDEDVTTGPAIVTEYSLKLTPEKTTITADSKDQTKIGILLTAPTETAATDKMKVAVDMVLGTSNIGSLSQTDVTLTYDAAQGGWYGEVVFTSATLKSAVKSTVKASVRTVVDGPADEQIVGVSSNEIVLELVPDAADSGVVTAAARATKAVVESCDRIILTFNQDVDIKDFLTTEGEVANGGYANADGTKPQAFKLYLQDQAKEQDEFALVDAAGNSSYDYTSYVQAIEQTSSRELTFILQNGKELSDNSKFRCVFISSPSTGVASIQSDTLSNYITDTSTPTVLSVETVDLKTIRITFDQPVVSYNGNVDNPNDLVKESALRALNFSIDGWNLGELAEKEATVTRKEDNADKVYSLFGNSVSIKVVDPNKRNAVDIVLGKASSGKGYANNGAQCYFEPGAHVLQVSNVGDYASLSEKNNSNNRITTKSLNFSVVANTATPSFNVEVQSPEQYIVTFTTPIAEIDSVIPGQEVETSLIQLKYKDSEKNMQKFERVSALGQDIKVTKLWSDDNNSRVKVEVMKDWTSLDGYKNENKLYMNYTLALVADENTLTNAVNGKKNAEITKVLTGAVQSYDGTSPTITSVDVVKQEKEKTTFHVTFDEPVQAGNKSLTTGYAHTNTPSYSKITGSDETMPDMTVKIVNTETKKTYDAIVEGYADLEDYMITVSTPEKLPAGSYILYATAVSDDAGNTCRTEQKPFTITKEETETVFKVLSILADKVESTTTGAVSVTVSGISSSVPAHMIMNENANVGVVNSETDSRDVIYVEFSSQYKAAPIETSVLNTANWTLNGAALPVGSYVRAGIPQTNFADSEHSGVTIVLPNNYLTSIHTTALKLNANVQNAAGKTLVGQTTFTTPSIFKGSDFATDDSDRAIYVQNLGEDTFIQLNGVNATYRDNK